MYLCFGFVLMMVSDMLNLKVEWMRKDGDYVHKGFLRQKKTASGLRLVDK